VCPGSVSTTAATPGDVARVDHADARVVGVGVEGARPVDRRDVGFGDVLQEQVGPHDREREAGVFEIAVAGGVRVDELRGGLQVGADDRAADQELDVRAAGRVDGVAVPAHRVGVRAGQHEHLLDPGHGRHQGAFVGEVTGDHLVRPGQAAGGFAASDKSPHLLTPARQLLQQRRANLASTSDDQNHDSSPPRVSKPVCLSPSLRPWRLGYQGEILDRID
jgi:hypothetical protein